MIAFYVPTVEFRNLYIYYIIYTHSTTIKKKEKKKIIHECVFVIK